MTRYCLHPGCRDRVTSGRCTQHSRNGQPQSARYGHDWATLRAQAIADTERRHFPFGGPVCVECERDGIATPMQELDHIVPLSQGGARLDPRNVQSLCRQHHEAKTARETAEYHSLSWWGRSNPFNDLAKNRSRTNSNFPEFQS